MKTEQLRKNLEEIGVEIVKEVVEQLLAADKNATGSLVSSVKYEILETANDLMLNILANDYFKYIDEGRRPGRMPPVKAIIPWVQARGIKFMDREGGMISQESTAFLIARSIGKKGIKPLNIKQSVITNILDRKREFIAAGIKIDIQEYINKEIFQH